MLKQHNNEVCEEHRKICPLPRIGSKGWGWTRFYGRKGWGSKQTALQIDLVHGKWCVLEDGCLDAISRAACDNLVDAKRIAELLARRDWRRENRGKK